MFLTPDDLSLNQIAALRQVASGRNIPFDIWKPLLWLDLVESKYDTEACDDILHDVLTDEGRKLLEQLDGA